MTDFTYALRQIRRNPGFSFIAIATLALGIGVNAAMFSAVDAVLIRPLPYTDAASLVMVWDDNSGVGDSEHFLSTPPEWYEWRRLNTVFTDIAATQPGDAALSGLAIPKSFPHRRLPAISGTSWASGRCWDARSPKRKTRAALTSCYFPTVGAQLRGGRFFDASDRRSDAPAAIINESFANRHFPGRSPVGARFQFGQFGPKAYWYTIVGVVKEIRDRGVAEELRPTVYRVHEQADQSGDQPGGIVIRTSVDAAAITGAVRQAIWSVDKNQPIARVQTLDDIITRQLSAPSQNTALLGAFALLGLVLASLGLYGVLSYSVTQRTGEIGVRMALGATARDILLSFSRRGLTLTLAGLAIGLVVTMMAARVITTLFYGFQPDVLAALAVAATVLLAVAALACLVPARRASRVNPVTALQHE